MCDIINPEFVIEKYILQGKIRKVADALHNKILYIKTPEEMKEFIENELNINISEEIKKL